MLDKTVGIPTKVYDSESADTPRIINTLTKAITENLIIQFKKTPDLMLI